MAKDEFVVTVQHLNVFEAQRHRYCFHVLLCLRPKANHLEVA
jgi:hypothetical protein